MFSNTLADPTRWYFTNQQIENAPSVAKGLEQSKELYYRRRCANFIQAIGRRLQLSQTVINTAMVYMHRFYMHQPFQRFHWQKMAPCFLFAAAKIEGDGQFRPIGYIQEAASQCSLDESGSTKYKPLGEEILQNELALLITLGFETGADHPHNYVEKCAQLINANEQLTKTAYFLATNSLHMTTFCLQYHPEVIASVCMHLACLWAEHPIPESNSGKSWYEANRIDNRISKELLENLAIHYVRILDSSPTFMKSCGGTGVLSSVVKKLEGSAGFCKTQKCAAESSQISKVSAEENKNKYSPDTEIRNTSPSSNHAKKKISIGDYWKRKVTEEKEKGKIITEQIKYTAPTKTIYNVSRNDESGKEATQTALTSRIIQNAQIEKLHKIERMRKRKRSDKSEHDHVKRRHIEEEQIDFSIERSSSNTGTTTKSEKLIDINSMFTKQKK